MGEGGGGGWASVTKESEKRAGSLDAQIFPFARGPDPFD